VGIKMSVTGKKAGVYRSALQDGEYFTEFSNLSTTLYIKKL
jgi:hypothetical protein